MSAYQPKAQPCLDPVARGLRFSQAARDALIAGTAGGVAFRGSDLLRDEARSRSNPARTQPFWANVWFEPCADCICQKDGSKALESDAVFYLRAPAGRVLALHLEMKAPGDRLKPGQAATCPGRAACWQAGRKARKSLLPHDAWATVLICPDKDRGTSEAGHFDRAITHGQAAGLFPRYPPG